MPIASASPVTYSDAKGKWYNYRINDGKKLYDDPEGNWKMLKPNNDGKIGHEDIIGLLEGFNQAEGNTTKNNIIAHLSSTKDFSADLCNRIVKAVMRRALYIGLNETNCPEYKTLSEFFKLSGTPKYANGSDFIITYEDTYSFKIKYTDQNTEEVVIDGEKRSIYKKETAEKIDKMLYNLVAVILATQPKK